jgi:prophage regulatory protein
MRLLDYQGLKAKGFNYSRTHIWRLVKAGHFPKPLKLGTGSRNAWVEEEIDALIAAKIAERDAPRAADDKARPSEIV